MGLKHQQATTRIALAHQSDRALSQWKDIRGEVQSVRFKMGSSFGPTGRRTTKFIKGGTGLYLPTCEWLGNIFTSLG